MARFFDLRMTIHHRITNGRMLANLIRNEAATPMILSMSWERSAHSVATHRKRGGCFYTGRVRLTEPNFGEYRIRMCDFMGWWHARARNPKQIDKLHALHGMRTVTA